MGIIFLLLSDQVWLWILELFIAIIFLRAVLWDIIACLNSKGIVTRGDKSQGILLSFWAMAVIIIEIILSTDIINNYKILVGLINLFAFLYLFIFSSYFTNKIIGWSGKLHDKKYHVY